MTDITNQIHETVALAIKEQLDVVPPFCGAYRRFDDLRLNLSRLFPKESSWKDNDKAIALIKKILKQDIWINSDFEYIKTKEHMVVYTHGKAKKQIIETKNETERPDESKYRQKYRSELRDFAFFPDFELMLTRVANMAESEVWHFSQESTNSSYIILEKYLNNVLVRLKYERDELGFTNKIVTAPCEVRDKNGHTLKTMRCIFNTGLISRGGKYIYLLFDKNTKADAKEWFFKDVSCDPTNQNFLPLKGKLPVPADFYAKLTGSELFYKKNANSINLDHILLDHCERLPIEFLKSSFQDYFSSTNNPLKNIKDWNDLKSYMADLKAKDEYDYRAASDVLLRSIEQSQRRAMSGDAYRVLIYRPSEHSVAFFLPLYLRKPKYDGDFEVGVIVNKCEDQYVVRTIYRTSMAYDKIRVMGNPKRSWLNPEKITLWKSPFANDLAD